MKVGVSLVTRVTSLPAGVGPASGLAPAKQTHKYSLSRRDDRSTTRGKLPVEDSNNFSNLKTITGGQALDLESGALRELHLLERRRVAVTSIEGKVSVSMFRLGRCWYCSRNADRADVGYIRRKGTGYSLRTSATPCRIYSVSTRDYADIGMTVVDGRQPARRAGHEFRQAGTPLEKFPRRDVFLADKQYISTFQSHQRRDVRDGTTLCTRGRKNIVLSPSGGWPRLRGSAISWRQLGLLRDVFLGASKSRWRSGGL